MNYLLILLTLTASLYAQGVYALFNATASKESLLTTSVNGVIKRTYVNAGDTVRRNQLLLELDTDELRQSLDVDRANIALAQEHVNYAQEQLQRYTNVKEYLSDDNYRQFVHQYNLQKANLAIAKANARYKETLIAKATLRAPFDGNIVEKMVDQGGFLSAASPAFRIVDRRVKMVIEFDDRYLPNVRVGSSYRYHLAGVAQYYRATITKIYPTVDPRTKRVKAEAWVKGLKVGQFGDGWIE